MYRALRNPVLASFLLALLLRVGFAVFENARHGATLEWPDEELHWQIACNLAQHGQFATDDGRLAARMPLYPLFLTPFAVMGSVGVPTARIAQAILSALVVPIGAWLARRAFGQRAAWLAGALLALDPFSTYFAARLLTEVPYTLLAIALTGAAWRTDDLDARTDRMLHDRYFVRMSLASLVLSLIIAPLAAAAILIRQSSIGWVALLLIASWWFDGQKGRATLRLATRVVVIGLLMLPWGLRNRAVLGDFAWLSANGGVTLYDAQGPQADGSSNQAFLQQMPQLADLGEIERDRELGRLALEQMRRDPGRVLRLAWSKLLRTWSPFPNAAEYRGGAAAWIGAGYSIVVVALALAALLPTIRREVRSRARQLQFHLWLPVLAFTILHCLYIGSVRYRVPLMPMLTISAAGAVARRNRRESETPIAK